MKDGADAGDPAPPKTEDAQSTARGTIGPGEPSPSEHALPDPEVASTPSEAENDTATCREGTAGTPGAVKPSPEAPSPSLLALGPPPKRLALAPPSPRPPIRLPDRSRVSPETGVEAGEAPPPEKEVPTGIEPPSGFPEMPAAPVAADVAAIREGSVESTAPMPVPAAATDGGEPPAAPRASPPHVNPTWPAATAATSAASFTPMPELRTDILADPVPSEREPAPHPDLSVESTAPAPPPVPAPPDPPANAEVQRPALRPPVAAPEPSRPEEPREIADTPAHRTIPTLGVPVFEYVPPPPPSGKTQAIPGPPEAQRLPRQGTPIWAPADHGTAERAPPAYGVIARRALRYSAFAVLGLAGTIAILIFLYRWIDPPTSTLMLGQQLAGTTVRQRWVPIERISPNLQLAVIVSEDGRFCRHRGVDWEELESAIEDGVGRGGSTIPMQTVKNLFLWPARSYVRKAIEIPLAYAVSAAWSKRRLLEIYLNIAEWGPGVFGAEAAARYHFRKPASLLTAQEAALLAVSLPNPIERRAGAPGPGTQRLASNLMLRMRAAPSMAGCVRSSREF